MSLLHLPEDLELQALSKFDTLVAQGRLFFEETEGEPIEDNGFKVNGNKSLHFEISSLLTPTADEVHQLEFRISWALSRKPILSQNAPERRGLGGPFLDPDPDFVVSDVGDGHILELNMHCIYRPMYILHTRGFKSQDEDLDLDDFIAARAVMTNLGRSTPQIAIYNCGAEAGASQGHKHMQIFTYPSPFPLFPEQAQSTQEITSGISGIPYQHFVLRLPETCQVDDIMRCYTRLLSAMRAEQDEGSNVRTYNLCLTDSWLCLVPRRHGRSEGVGTNAAGMLGLVWVSDQAEREAWDRLGRAHHLELLGVPN